MSYTIRSQFSKIRAFATVQTMLMLTVFAITANAQSLDTAAIKAGDILNLATPTENILTAGQPTQEQFQLLAKSGVKHIVNLRPADEQDWDEAAYVQSLGMEYHSIPVAGAAGVSVENAQTLDALLKNLDGQPLLVHCASSNRVGALRALTASQSEGATLEAAVSTGKEWGLKSLEPRVRDILAEHAH